MQSGTLGAEIQDEILKNKDFFKPVCVIIFWGQSQGPALLDTPARPAKTSSEGEERIPRWEHRGCSLDLRQCLATVQLEENKMDEFGQRLAVQW